MATRRIFPPGARSLSPVLFRAVVSTALIELSSAALNNDLWFSNVFKGHPVLFMAAPQTSVWAYIPSLDFISTTTL